MAPAVEEEVALMMEHPQTTRAELPKTPISADTFPAVELTVNWLGGGSDIF